jgi:hypothetical protein
MPKQTKTPEERRAAEREYQRQRYAERKEEIRKRNLDKYYERKETNPEFHSKPRGRPRKDEAEA